MKKHIFSFFAFVLVAQFCWAVTSKEAIPDYYKTADGKSGDNLWSAVSNIAAKGYSVVSYKPGLNGAYKKSDVYPADSVGKAGKLWDMYGECLFDVDGDACGNYSGVCDCWNKEHSIPQSWWGGGTSGIGCDMFHVVPTDGKINGVRDNDEYGIVADGTTWMGNKSGTAGSWSTDRKTIASAANEVINGSGKVFEPKNQYKGDLARGILGTIVKWEKSDLKRGNKFFSGVYNAANYYGLEKKAVVLLMKWHREDPVSQKEIDRNNGIQETQGNRNPFIDYPYLAEYIWGEHAGETVDMSKLMPSTDPDFIQGVSDGWRGESIPVGPVTKFGVTWSVNGEELSVDSIVENKKVQEFPDDPTSCSHESNVFMGWTDAPIYSTAFEAPEVLYTNVSELPAVTEDVTYYAVFAKQETTENDKQSSEETFDFAQIYTNGAKAGATTQGDVTVTFAKGNGSNDPAYYSSGTAVRCYPKNTITVASEKLITGVKFAFGTSDNSNSISADNGTYIEPDWTGEANNVVFTIGGTNNHRRIAGIKVTLNGPGTQTSYTRFITSCQTPTEVEPLTEEGTVRKVLINGHLYILRENSLYDAVGRRIR